MLVHMNLPTSLAGNTQLTLSDEQHSDVHYPVLGKPQFKRYSKSNIKTNEVYYWKIRYSHFLPRVLWISDAQLRTGKTVTWRVIDDTTVNSTLLWDMTISTTNLISLGKASYWIFPNPTIIYSNTTVFFQSSTDLEGIIVFGDTCSVVADEFEKGEVAINGFPT